MLLEGSKSSDPNLFFDKQAAGGKQEAEQGEQVPIPVAGDNHLGGRSDISQIIEVLYDAIEMDDDNNPALENIPQDNEKVKTVGVLL